MRIYILTIVVIVVHFILFQFLRVGFYTSDDRLGVRVVYSGQKISNVQLENDVLKKKYLPGNSLNSNAYQWRKEQMVIKPRSYVEE